MRTSFYLLIACMAACTGKHEPSKASVLHSLLDTLQVAPHQNMMVYALNPDDCISCLNGFKLFDKNLNTPGVPVLYVIATSREVEKRALQEEIKYPDLSDGDPSKLVVWDRTIYNDVNKSAGVGIALTTVIVYNYDRDTILYSKPVREITDMADVANKLKGR